MPQHLYKYHAYTAEAIESLVLRQIWLADVAALNDPYDLSLRVEEPPAFDEFKRFVEERDNATYSDEEATEKHEATKRLHARINEEVETVGVYCVSEVCDELLMWAHYADGHRGFCIEYDMAASTSADFEPVRYVETHARRVPFASAFQGWESVGQALREITLTKPSALAYEKEWRLARIHVDRHDRRLPMPSPVSSIIFGCRTPIAHIRTLMTIATSQFGITSFTRMEKGKHGFELERKPFVWPPDEVPS